MATIKVSKLDAARRQLDGAIQLWFHEGDVVAIHALACAAHQVIQDIAEQKGARAYHLDDLIKQVVEPQHQDEARQNLRKPMMFIKHADRDPHAVLELDSAISDFFIMLAICCLRDIGESVSDIQRAFVIYNDIHATGWFKEDSLDSLLQRVGVNGIQDMRNIKKRDFLKGALLATAQIKTRGL